MNSLKWIKDNWVIFIGSVLVLSTLSLEMTYSFYGFEILNYLDAQEIVKKSLTIAASLCVYTNHHFSIEELESES